MRLALVNGIRQESRQLYEYTLCPVRRSKKQYYQKLHIQNHHFHPLFGKKKKKRCHVCWFGISAKDLSIQQLALYVNHMHIGDTKSIMELKYLIPS